MPAKILIVDDERDVIELISFDLHVQGHEVLTANGGLKALLLARRYRGQPAT